jgi:FtsP/CotA-like multicopper oxidase with cupredoxin domain
MFSSHRRGLAAAGPLLLAAACLPVACASSPGPTPSPDTNPVANADSSVAPLDSSGGEDGGSGGEAGASDGGGPPLLQQPAGWDQGLRVPEAVDINPDPSIVEVNLTAQVAPMSLVPGGTTNAWTYNGLLPGPQIRAKVGDRVIVHFTNNLPDTTTIHWHGLRIPNAMDGMPGVSQPPIAPGGSFDYDFVVPDASLFWFHPHVDSAAQVGYGMYAPFVVEEPQEPAGLGDEVVLVLSDMSLNADGTFIPETAGGDVGALFGAEGSLLLVNGKSRPTLKARPGLRQRWRLVNAARSRYFQISFPGHSFLRIGGDGGLLASPVAVDQPVLAPAERADLLVVPNGDPGTDIVVSWVAFDRGFGTAFNRPPEDLFVVHLEGDPVATPPLPDIHRDIQPIDLSNANLVSLQLTEDSLTPLELGINGVPYDKSQPLVAYVGETQVWEISNTIQFAHPFHLHGFFFQVISPQGPLEWKDTVSVPVNGTVQFVVRYDDRPGMWMYHCHILDHAEAGMMGSLMVMEPGTN